MHGPFSKILGGGGPPWPPLIDAPGYYCALILQMDFYVTGPSIHNEQEHDLMCKKCN